jgi:hypothetical protein
MKTTLFIAALVVANFMGYSQSISTSGQWLQDNFGKPIMSNNYIDADGNPYFPKEWVAGGVVLKTGNTITYNALRYNTINGTLEFQLDNKPYEVISPIVEFNLGAMLFRKGFESVDKQNGESYYQVLYDGKQKLLCYRIGIIYIASEYNSATKTKKVDLSEYYYVEKEDGKLYPVKKNIKNLLALVDDKSGHINEYCQKENIKIKSWDDVAKVLGYADSLGK